MASSLSVKHDPEDADRASDILDTMLAQIIECVVHPISQVIAHAAADAYPSRLGQSFETRGDIHAITENAAIFHHHIADIDADPKLHSPLCRQILIGAVERLLNGNCAVNGINDTGKLGQHAVASRA